MARECLWIRISKGGVLEQTDEVLRDRTTYRQRLEELKTHGNLLGLASDTGAVRSESDRHHAAVEGLGGAREDDEVEHRPPRDRGRDQVQAF